MKIMKYLTMGILFIGMTALMGCKKEDFQPKGNYVTVGQNNNKVQSAIYIIGSLAWSHNSSDTYWYKALDASNLDLSGAVFVYKNTGGNTYESLSTANATNYNEAIGFDYDMDYQEIGITHTSITGASIPNPGLETFKVVTIPTSGMKIHPNVDFTNYEEVSKTFGLE